MEPTTQAASSPAPIRFDSWDQDGNPVQSKPKADPAPADTSKEKPEDAADSAAKQQENGKKQRRPDVEDRFSKLTREHREEVARLTRELEEARRPKEAKAESQPAKPTQPQSYDEWRKEFKSRAWLEKYFVDHPGIDTEDGILALNEHIDEVRERFRSVERLRTENENKLRDSMAKAKERHPDWESKVIPLVRGLHEPGVSPDLYKTIGDSVVLEDLLYVIGGTEQSTKDFIAIAKSNPSKALRMALLMEQEIINESKKAEKQPEEKPKEQETPAIPKPRAPKPPTELGGRGASPEDELQAASKANDFRRFEAEQLRRMRSR
jgi:hypothetical protein